MRTINASPKQASSGRAAPLPRSHPLLPVLGLRPWLAPARPLVPMLVSAWNPRARALQPVLAGSFLSPPKHHHLPVYRTRGQWLRLF